MSDFDEEAERQRLREKFDRDRQKRQETQRMSELLLKGATMTNRHCDRCGDPIFRYQGQEFCPSCDAGGAEAAQAPDEADANGSADAATRAATASEAQEAPEGQTPRTDTTASSDEAGSATGDIDPATPDANVDAGGRTSPAASAASTPPSTPTQRDGDDAPSLDAARASLVRTLTRHAERAERLDDPRRATEHLAVVREAAEALSALDR